MHILSLHIREFGGLRDISADLSKGLNLISGNNESGKSTLIAFIRFMLYGFPKRAAGEALSDGERAFSWENGIADGSMTVEKNEKIYRIERREQSGTGKKLLQIIDEASGLPLPKGDAPGIFLLGFPVEVFDSTACIRQLRSGAIDGKGLSGAIENLLLSGDESVNTEKVLKALDKARTSLLYKNKNGGEIYRLDNEISDLSARLSHLCADAEELKETALLKDELKTKLADAETALERAEEHCRLLSVAHLLIRFDALRAEEERLNREKDHADQLEKRHTRNGFLPNTAYIRALEGHIHCLDADERTVLRCDTERRIAEEAPAGDEALLRTASAIREAGGRSSVLSRLNAYTKEILSASRLPKLCFPIGAAALLLGILLTVISKNPLLLLVSLGALVSAGGFIGIKRKRQAETARDILLRRIGIATAGSNPTAEFISLADRAAREEERAKIRSERLEAAQNAWTRAKDEETAHRNEAANTAYRVLPVGSPVSVSVLRELSTKLSEEISERERTAQAVALYEQNYRRMAGSLAAYDEAELRKRIPEGFDYTRCESDAVFRERRDRAKEVLTALESERLAVERRLSALEATVGSPEELEKAIEERTAEKAELEAKYRAVLLAHESVSAARDGLKSRINPRLREDASKYLERLSDGRYGTLSLDREFALSTEENGRVHPSDAFSGGTRDAMYLSLRLALTDLLGSGGDPLPILLDESLAQLDDTRAKALLSILLARAENGGQSLLFTCHSREEEMLNGTSAHRIKL